MMPEELGPGSAVHLDLAGHDHVLMKFLFSPPPGNIQLRSLILPPSIPL